MAAAGKQGKLVATHVTDGQSHATFVKELRVMLMPDEKSWFAKGLDIDYAACGTSYEEAKDNFVNGLALTIQEHLILNGNLDKLMVASPPEAWEKYLKLSPDEISKESLSMVTIFKQAQADESTAKAFPFDGIRFIETTAESVSA